MSEIFIYDLTDTWNNSGNVFDAIKMNVTNTASASGSKLLNLQVGGVERFTVDVDGTASATTPTSGDNSTKLATTAFVQGELAGFATAASPAFTGTPTAPTATAGTDTSQIATTAFVQDAFSSFQFDISNVTATWNDAGTVFTGIGLDVTDTASAAGSKLIDIKKGGTSFFEVLADISDYQVTERTGSAIAKEWITPRARVGGGSSKQGLDLGYGGKVRWSSAGAPDWNSYTTDLALERDSAGVLKVTDGSTGQGNIIANSFIIDGADGVEHTIGTVAAGYLTFTRAGGTTNPIAFYEPEARVQLKNTGKFGWTSVSHAAASMDLALERESAGVLKVTDGSTGYGTILAGDGTESAAAYAHGGTGYGMFFKSGRPAFSHSAGIVAAFNAGTLAFGSNKSITWTNGDPVNNSTDLGLIRDSAGVLKISDGSTGYGKIVADGYQLNNPINSQTGTTYTAAVADAERYVQLDNAAAITVTVPSDTTANLPIGSTVTFEQTGAGTVTFAADSGVTINSRGAVLSTAGQFAVATIIKTASNTFTLTGDLV